jgi:hypothetical protein
MREIKDYSLPLESTIIILNAIVISVFFTVLKSIRKCLTKRGSGVFKLKMKIHFYEVEKEGIDMVRIKVNAVYVHNTVYLTPLTAFTDPSPHHSTHQEVLRLEWYLFTLEILLIQLINYIAVVRFNSEFVERDEMQVFFGEVSFTLVIFFSLRMFNVVLNLIKRKIIERVKTSLFTCNKRMQLLKFISQAQLLFFACSLITIIIIYIPVSSKSTLHQNLDNFWRWIYGSYTCVGIYVLFIQTLVSFSMRDKRFSIVGLLFLVQSFTLQPDSDMVKLVRKGVDYKGRKKGKAGINPRALKRSSTIIGNSKNIRRPNRHPFNRRSGRG